MVDAGRHEAREQRDAAGHGALGLQLLGGFGLVRDGEAVDALNAQRRQLLLGYLALQRGAVVERSRLAAVLWPESTERQARTNLRHLLYTLRRALPDFDLLVEDDGRALSWRMDAPCSVDCAGFLEALERADAAQQRGDPERALAGLQRAIACYSGELLPGHHDEWVIIERERLARAFLTSLERAAQLLEGQRDYPAAIEYRQQVVRLDPLGEAGYRALMRSHALNGEGAAVVQVYQACVAALEQEIGVEPAAETRDLYQALLGGVSQGSPPSGASAPPPAPLIGRRAEWARLEDLWREASAGRPQMALLSGEAGIGKTRLAEELLDWLRRQGVTALSARCYSAEGALSFAPVVDWLRSEPVQVTLATLDDPWLSEVGRLLPEIRGEWPDLPQPSPLTEGWQRQRLFEALARAILSARQPLALLIDDLQWCDQDTLEWLRFLLRFQADARLLLLGTLRPEELTTDHPLLSLIISLHHDGQLAEVMLESLSEAETAELVASLLGHEMTGEDAQRLYRETEGNPLFVVEMTRAGLHGGQERRALPATVQAAISGRLGLLSKPALEVVGLAATIGREFSVAQLAAASTAGEERLVDALDELSQRRIVREQGGGVYDFTHDKLREVAYGQLGDVRRRLLHRRVAQAIERDLGADLDAAAGRLAYHFERAGLADRAAGHYLRAAAQARQVYANHEAIRFYRRGLALAESDRQAGRLRLRLLEGLGDVLLLSGAHQSARDVFIQAIEAEPKPDGDELARLQRKLGTCLMTGDDFAGALAAYTAAEAALGEEPANLELWIDLQMDRMLVHYRQGDWQAMQAIADVAGPLIERSGPPWQRFRFVGIHTNVGLRRERFVVSDQVVERIDEAVAVAREAGDLSGLANMQFSLGFVTLWHGDPAGAAEAMQTALDLARRTGDTPLQVLNLTYLAISSRRLGRVEDTDSYARQALDLATRVEMPTYVAAANANLAWLAWRRGDQDRCERLANMALDSWQSGTAFPFQWLALWPLIDLASSRGDTAEALTLARRLLDETQQRLPGELEAGIEAALAAGDARGALRQAGELGYL